MTKKEFQGKIYRNLASKKFQALIASVLLSISTAIAQGITWQQAQLSVIVLIAGYISVQGYIDYTKAKK